MRRTLIALLTALAFLVAHSCQKPYETGIDLAVNNEKIEIPSSAEGHCYITVFSNKDWTIALEPAGKTRCFGGTRHRLCEDGLFRESQRCSAQS